MKIKQYILSRYIYQPLLAGSLLAASRLPIHTGFLSFLFLIPLLVYFQEDRSTKRSIVAGITFSISYTTVGLHWISLVTVGGFLGLYLLFGIYFSILFGLINFFSRKLPRLRSFAIILFWILFEYLQNFGEFRFPWFNLGYSLADYLSLIQLADIGGVYLLSILILIINLLLYDLRNRKVISIVGLLVLLLIWAGYGKFRLKTIDIIKSDKIISMVQVSVSQEQKWEESYLDSTINLYRDFSMKASEDRPDLIIWPESALPIYLLRYHRYREFITDLADKIQIDIFTGFPHYELAKPPHPQKYKFYNSASRFTKNGHVDLPYYKIYLVPVGERMPLLKIFPILWNVQLGQANFEYGEEIKYFELAEYKYSPLICFEIVFSDLTRKMALGGVDFIVNLTNDAWFYRSAGTYQHAVMTKFRAIETRKQIFRAANTGFSLIVSPTGEYLQKSELFERTILKGSLLLCEEKTFFTKYFHLFPFVLITLSVGLLLVLAVKVRKKQ
jgi:apolipoprotein N-acyltransferase